MTEKKNYWNQYMESLSEQQNPSSMFPSYYKGLQYYWMNGEYDEEIIVGMLRKINKYKDLDNRPGDIITSEEDLLSLCVFVTQNDKQKNLKSMYKHMQSKRAT